LNKNCSYYFLPLLEVVEPDLRLKDPFVLRTAPVDSIRVLLRQPGLVGSPTRRLSLTSQLLERRKLLNAEEIQLVEAVQKDPSQTNALASLAPERQAMVLDAAYSLFRYKVGFKRDPSVKVQEKDHALLRLRNNVSATSPSLELSTSTVLPPHI